MLHVVKPETRKRGRRFLFINPPLDAPGRMTKKPAWEKAGNGDGWTTDPDWSAETFHLRGYTFPLPIGLLRIANHLLRQGNEIYFLDCFSAQPASCPSSMHRRTPAAEPAWWRTGSTQIRPFHLGLTFPEIERILGHVQVDEVYVGCTFTYHNEPAHRVIALARARLPGVPITFGGIYPTLAPEEAARSEADEVFVGPYPGLEDLSLNYDFLGHPPPFILVKGTSGCPHRCAYCAVHKLEGNRFSHRDPHDVFAEIQRAHERYGLKHLGMWDSNLLMRYEDYLGPLLRQIIDSGLRLRISAPEGLDYRLLTEEIAHDLWDAGFQYVALALENVDSDYARNTLNRRNSLERLKRAVGFLKAVGFREHQTRLFVMIGMPGQTLENVIENIRFVWSLGCNVTLFPFTPIPGTPVYENHRDDLAGLPLKALHPTLLPCVKDDDLAERLWELTALGELTRAGKAQSEHFREVIRNPDLVRCLE
jgi:biotin synthase-like enzyme